MTNHAARENTMANLTDYQCYRSMSWTSDADKCEHCDKNTMGEGRYVEGRYGHYCSTDCLAEAETGGMEVDEEAAERRQMGITG